MSDHPHPPSPAGAAPRPAGHAHDHGDHGDHAHDHGDHAHDHDDRPAQPAHAHAHGDDGHDHGGGHGHHHHHDDTPLSPRRRLLRALIVVLVAAVALLAASFGIVPAGSAAVVSRLGDPVRVRLEPGPLWRLPLPLERLVLVDRRIQTTVGGQHGVLTRDGLSLVAQAYVAWRVRGDPDGVLRFVRAVGNRPDEAADQLRTLLGSALETVTGRFATADLVNADPAQLRLDAFERALREAIAAKAEANYGIEVVQIALQRLMLPDATVEVTTARMVAERETLAEGKKARGREEAGAISSAADKDVRLARAAAEEQAARTVADAKAEAAGILADARARDPQLYEFMRSLDALEASLGAGTRLILRTDAAPLRALIDGPPAPPAPDAAVSAPPADHPHP